MSLVPFSTASGLLKFSTTLSARVESSLHEVASVVSMDDGIRVTTHCMYPSNGLVRVTVRGGADTLVASDEGEALGEALAAGIEIANPDRLLGPFVRGQGLLLSNGIIHTAKLPAEAAAVAVIHVANAAKDAASWLYEHNKLNRTRDFRDLLSKFLSDTFRDNVSEAKIVGASNKPHKFTNVISFPNGRRLIVDAVVKDASSINSRVIANLDIKSVNDPKIEQRIVYDDGDSWAASDLNLLQIGATVVPFSRANDVIRRIADQTRSVA